MSKYQNNLGYKFFTRLSIIVIMMFFFTWLALENLIAFYIILGITINTLTDYGLFKLWHYLEHRD